MPILSRAGKLIDLHERITKMSMKQLIEYEELLWTWMDKANSPVNVARELNSIHREVEWRAQDTKE